jgi:hypothetical protein
MGFLGMVLIFQWRFGYEPERARLERQTEEAKRLLQKAEGAEEKRAELLDRQRQRESELAALRRRVPEELELEAFLRTFEDWVESAGAEIEDTRFETSKRDLYQQAELTIRLRAETENVVHLLERRAELERLVEWESDEELGKGSELTFRIFALPAPPSRVYRNPCREPTRGPSAWPFSAGITRRREELSRICTELEAHQDDIERALSYESLIAEVEMLHQFIAARESG